MSATMQPPNEWATFAIEFGEISCLIWLYEHKVRVYNTVYTGICLIIDLMACDVKSLHEGMESVNVDAQSGTNQ